MEAGFYSILFLGLLSSILLCIVFYEVFIASNKNLYAILIPGTILFMVNIQALWFYFYYPWSELTHIQHLRQEISFSSMILAVNYTSLFSLCYIMSYGFSLRFVSSKSNTVQLRKTLLPFTPITLFIIAAISVMAFIGMIILAGGPIIAFTRPGYAMAGGVVAMMTLLTLGKFAWLRNLASKQKSFWFLSLMNFTVVFIGLLITSRMLTMFLIVQVVLLYHYFVNPISKKKLILAGTSLYSILCIFGIYRDYSVFAHAGYDINLKEHFIKNAIPFEWLYQVNIEGFAGLAGILRYEEITGPVKHDRGFSVFYAFFKFIPGFIRNSDYLPLNELQYTIRGLYPYHGSVIPSGLECVYAHYGMLGILGLGFFLGVMTRYFHVTAMKQSVFSFSVVLISVYTLILIRGSTEHFTLYATTEAFLLCFASIISLTSQSFFKYTKGNSNNFTHG